MFGKIKVIGLDELDMTNSDLFIRKTATKLKKDAKILVADTHSAILVKNGEMINTLSSGKFPIFERGEDTKDTTVDVIFMSRTAKLKTLWGTSQKMVVRDPDTGVYVGIGASGEYEIQVSNPRKFYLEVIGASKTYTIDDLKVRLLGRIVNEIEKAIAKIILEKKTTYENISEYKREIADMVLPNIQTRFERDYGIKMHSLVISKMLVSPASIKELEKGEKMQTDKSLKDLFLEELAKEDYDKYVKVVAILDGLDDEVDVVAEDTSSTEDTDKPQAIEE